MPKSNRLAGVSTKNALSGVCAKAALALTAACCLWAAASVFICNYYGYKPAWLAVSALAALVLLAAAWYAADRFEPFFVRNSRLITACFLLFMGLVQTAMIFPLRYEPIFDIGALFGGAAEWAETGDFASYHGYFAMFHNNFGGLVLLRGVFGIAKLAGLADRFLAASLFNSALSLAAMYLTGSVCRELVGERGRVTAYFAFLISPPFYFIAPAFYTDALSMLFPVLTLRLYIAARSQKKPVNRLILFLLMGLAAGAGYCIKATAAIMLVAVFIDALLLWGAGRALMLGAIGAAAVLLCSLLTQAIVYRHLDRSEAERARIPVLHWVMMGAAGSGTYDPDEYEFTKSFSDPAERRNAAAERLFERLRSYGARELAGLFTRKLDIDFGDGTYGLSDCLGCPRGEDNFLHGFLLNEGENREAYKHICTGVILAVYILTIVSCVFGVIAGSHKAGALAPRLALLGLFIFLLAWEARWRYSSNHAPIFIISAEAGLDAAFARMNKRRRSI